MAEWFPAKERAWAVALFDSGSSIGGALAPFLVFSIYKAFGTWRPAVVIPGLLGGAWLLVWHTFYRRPEEHWRVSREELAYIQAAESISALPAHSRPIPWHQLLRYKQSWGIILGRFLLDPFWYMMSEWFAVYLVTKGFSIEASVFGYWAPFLAADVGNFLGGGLSSMFIARGWSVGRARRIVLWMFGPTMLILIAATLTSTYALLIIFFSIATLAYASCSTIFLSLPADVFESRAVASVSGLAGTAAGLGTLISTYLIGVVADRGSFQPVIVSASIIPLVAVILMTTLVRSSEKPDPFRLLRMF